MLRTCVIGEALIDIVHDPYGDVDEHVGGSPLNVAAGLARLGHEVEFATTIGHDPHGGRIAQHLHDRGVHLAETSWTPQPTSTARADLDETGAATYTFDLHWDLPPVGLSVSTGHVHTGSIGAVLSPGAETTLDAVRFMAERGTVSYDPNVRSSIMGSMDDARGQIEELIALADVVKASSDDLDTLYPGESTAAVMQRWCLLGASVTVVTLGAQGVAFRVRGDERVTTLPTRATEVVDTVGAGDSFMAGLLSGLLDAALLGTPEAATRLAGASVDQVQPAIERGLACSGITVGHSGAYSPTRDELG